MKKILLMLSFLHLFLIVSINAQWQRTNYPHENYSVGNSIDAVEDCAIVSTGKLYKTLDNGESWLELQTPQFNNDLDAIIDISITDKLHIWCATINGRIISSSDGGETWDIQFDNQDLTSFMNYIEMFDLYNGVAMGDAPDFLGEPSDSNKALFLSTKDGGMNWEVKENNEILFGSGNMWRRIDFVSLDKGYFFENFNKSLVRGVMRTTDGGNNWNVDSSTFGIVLKFYDESLGVCYSGNLEGTFLLKTNDGGMIWSDTLWLDLDWMGEDIEFAKNNPAKIWVSDFDKLYFTEDSGKTWINQTPSGQYGGRDIVMIDEYEGWILADYGIFHTTNGGLTSLNTEENLTTEFQLSQNYPNPFNPSTTIEFTIPNVASGFSLRNVQLKVYDILGREVKTLVNENKSPGTYKVNFDGNNLVSGIYYYRLTAGDASTSSAQSFVETKKMILMK